MVNILIIIFLLLLFVAGLLMLVSSLSKYSSYISTTGKIMEYLKCNPVDDHLEALEERHWNEAEVAMVVYTVNGESFRMATKNKKEWKKAGAKGEVEVFYNPYDPKDAHLKEGTPYLGGFIMAASAIGILLNVLF